MGTKNRKVKSTGDNKSSSSGSGSGRGTLPTSIFGNATGGMAFLNFVLSLLFWCAVITGSGIIIMTVAKYVNNDDTLENYKGQRSNARSLSVALASDSEFPVYGQDPNGASVPIKVNAIGEIMTETSEMNTNTSIVYDASNVTALVYTGANYITAITVSNRDPAGVNFLKIYDMTSVDITTDEPKLVFAITASNLQQLAWPHPIYFSTGISVRATRGLAATDNVAPEAVNDITLTIVYYPVA